MNLPDVSVPLPFCEAIQRRNLTIRRMPVEILQINLGKLCNQTCHHCHVESGPTRTEIMEKGTLDRLLELLGDTTGPQTVDITGGAPEINPNFRYFVSEAAKLKKKLIDRCNLTVLLEPGQEETAHFLRQHRVQIVASLPCYSKDNVEEQRGEGVFEKSIRALRLLNDLGYGNEASGLILDIIYNPVGAFLPPPQDQFETEYKKELKRRFGIEFNNLYTITNMPIKRFLHKLVRTKQLDDYMTLLANSFNPQAALEIMCRRLVSIGWDGQIYDCDFNQMLEIPIAGEKKTIWQIESFKDLKSGPIAFAEHCYGCTAGEGSSCRGSLVVDSLRNDK